MAARGAEWLPAADARTVRTGGPGTQAQPEKTPRHAADSTLSSNTPLRAKSITPLPPRLRIGYLLGSFDNFAGQYFRWRVGRARGGD